MAEPSINIPDGVTLYGLIAALIAVAVISGVTALGSNANSTFTKVSGEIAKGAK